MSTLKKLKDPRTFSASSLTNETFAHQFPFIDIDYMSPKEDFEGKFTPRPIVDTAVLSELIVYINGYMDDSRIIFNSGYDGQGESESRFFHYSILARFAKLSMALVVLKKRKREQNKKRKQDEKEETGLEGAHLLSPGEEREKEEEEGKEREEEEEPNSSDSLSSNGSLTEGCLLDEERKCGAGKAYLIVQSYRKDFIRKLPSVWNKHLVKQAQNCNALLTTIVIEFKDNTNDWPKGAFQAAYYAVLEGMKNLKQGRRKPIHIILWGMNTWCYGTVTVDGILTLENGEIVQSGGVSDNQLIKLTAQLKERESSLRKYTGDSSQKFEDGEYVFGKLSIMQSIFGLPKTQMCYNDEHLRFYQSLLRLFLGNSLLKLTLEDVKDMKDIVIENEKAFYEEEKLKLTCSTSIEIWKQDLNMFSYF